MTNGRTVIVTRAEPEAAATAARLEALGLIPLRAPLFATVFDDAAPLDLEGADALALTSAHGAEALRRRGLGFAGPVFAVGARTAQKAREAGFAHVVSANGDAGDLARLIETRLPAGARVLHVAGAEIARDLAALLPAPTFDVRRAAVYRAAPVETMPQSAARALRAGSADAVLLFSPRAAEVFASLAAAQNLSLDGLIFACLSPAIAERTTAPAVRVIVPERPEAEHLLAALAARLSERGAAG